MTDKIRFLVFNVLVVILLVFSFIFGRLSVLIDNQKNQQAEIRVIEDMQEPELAQELLSLIKGETKSTATTSSVPADVPPGAKFVASKSSATKKFHPIGSGTANRIKAENRIYFASADEALAAGYEPSSAVK